MPISVTHSQNYYSKILLKRVVVITDLFEENTKDALILKFSH
jgi:hypothetical protein